MRRSLLLPLGSACLLVLLPCLALAQARQETPAAPRSMPAAVHPGPQAPSPALSVPVTTLEDARSRVDLPLPEPGRLQAARERSAAPVRIGFEREVSAPAGRIPTEASEWHALPDGRLMSTVAVRSAGAVGVRLGLRVERAPWGTLLLVHRPGEADRAIEPLEAGDLEADLDGEVAPRRGTARRPLTWSAVIDGDTTLLDIVLPHGAPASEVSIRVQRVAHLESSPTPGTSMACNRDIRCEQSWSRIADSVAHYVFQGRGYTAICTGTLLNNTGGEPLFLTAAHCIGNRSQARSMALFWSYERTSCGSQRFRFEETVGGARLLATTGQPTRRRGTPDITLLHLNQAPPAGSILSGWDANPIDPAPVRGIHHPMGDVKKISTGDSDGVVTIAPKGPPTHHLVEWTEGVTEGGSSGSGLFVGESFPDQFLIGVLTGGPEPSCTPHVGIDYYGRLDLAYPKLDAWLR